MVALDATQERNLRAALSITDNEAEQLRIAFGAWTESRGYNYANDGRNTSNSPGVTPAIKEILKRSLSIPHDMVGSNGRSTGIFQQTSHEVGGGWGDMAGTMDPPESTRRFLAALHVTDSSQYSGTLLTPTGSKRVTVQLSDPIAADVLRVQSPLADEAESSNYGASQVAIARQIVAQLAVKPPPPKDEWMGIDMADQKALDAFRDDIIDAMRKETDPGHLIDIITTQLLQHGVDNRTMAQLLVKAAADPDQNGFATSVWMKAVNGKDPIGAQIIGALDSIDKRLSALEDRA